MVVCVEGATVWRMGRGSVILWKESPIWPALQGAREMGGLENKRYSAGAGSQWLVCG